MLVDAAGQPAQPLALDTVAGRVSWTAPALSASAGLAPKELLQQVVGDALERRFGGRATRRTVRIKQEWRIWQPSAAEGDGKERRRCPIAENWAVDLAAWTEWLAAKRQKVAQRSSKVVLFPAPVAWQILLPTQPAGA